MSYNLYSIVKTIVFFSLLIPNVHPVSAFIPDENGSDSVPPLDISGIFSGFIDIFYDNGSGTEEGNRGSDIFETIDNIHLVQYEEPEINGDLGKYIKENINSSISQEVFSENTGLQRDLYILLSESLRSSNSFYVDGFEVFIYPLVTDEDLSSPSCLSRPNGLKITLDVDNINEPEGKTIWVYEKYSTDIIRNIYEEGYADEFGTFYIKFMDVGSGKEIIHMVLDAADAEVYRTYWNNPESYVGIEDWSKVKFNDDYELAFYEDNLNRISMDSEEGLQPGIDSEEDLALSDKTVASYDPLLINSILDSYSEIVSRLDDIGEYCNNGERKQVLSSANDLGEYLYKVGVFADGIPVSEDISWKKSRYLEAVEIISGAASDYWHFAVYHDSDSLSRASENSDTGLMILNDLVDSIGVNPVDVGSLDRPSERSSIVRSYSMLEPFHYMDSAGSNDISLQVVDWNLKSSLLTKNIDTGGHGTLLSEYNTEFLVVSVVFTHMGYRGGGTEQIVTPPESSFKLQYGGNEYSPLIIDDYLENSGEPYQSKKVERREIYKSVLAFEIENNPGQTFDDEDAYLSVELGDYGVQTWNLEK